MTQQTHTLNDIRGDLRYLQLLSESFPTTAAASTEIINLEAILNLPKGTEHFLADVHGEYEAFDHVLKNASGAILRKIKEIFDNSMLLQEMSELATLVYYPREVLEKAQKELEEEARKEWYRITLHRLVMLCRKSSEKYTRSKVRKALPPEYSYILEELLHEKGDTPSKVAYTESIFNTIISIDKADDFIIALCQTIKRMVIDHLHIVGDIYDRGPGAQHIMDTVLAYHHVDIQWGNHDVLWMGAAAGNLACMANVIRIALRYANLDTIEDGYGINLLPLATFAMETYKGDPCSCFQPKLGDAETAPDSKSVYLISQMHKAIAIIQFKLEYQLIQKHPEYKMSSRNLLHKINFEEGTIDLSGTAPNGGYGVHPMKDTHFPTIDPKDPYALTEGELAVVEKLRDSFQRSEKLHRHIRCMYSKGSLYLAINGNLLFHASMPLNEKGQLKEVLIDGTKYKGKALYEHIETIVREAYFGAKGSSYKENACDYMWYLWCGSDSPLFDKSAMTTLERYFVEDKATHTEVKGYYYQYRNDEQVADRILKEFALEGESCHIINGHVPVKAKKGEKPVMAGGKLLVIDGGFSRAYQSTTGIAGYTLIFNSRGMQLVQHDPFSCKKDAIDKLDDIKSVTILTQPLRERIYVRDTNVGIKLQGQIDNLKKLLAAYRLGLIKEKP